MPSNNGFVTIHVFPIAHGGSLVVRFPNSSVKGIGNHKTTTEIKIKSREPRDKPDVKKCVMCVFKFILRVPLH